VNVPGYSVVTLYGIAQPRLGAANLGNGQLALSWAQAGAGFVLQSTSNLSPTTIWTALTNNGSITDDVASVTLSSAQTAQFYRLILP
jgi:hypothetical protein